MAFSPDTFKSLLQQQKGFASANQYEVELPQINSLRKVSGGRPSQHDAETLRLTCSAINLPGRQLLTYDRQIGMELLKVGYGYANPDVTLTFQLTNTYEVKRYFDEWQDCVVSREPPYEAGFFDNYAAKSVKIWQKTRDKYLHQTPIYGVELQKCYPTTMNDISFSNELDAISELTVSFSYKNWIYY